MVYPLCQLYHGNDFTILIHEFMFDCIPSGELETCPLLKQLFDLEIGKCDSMRPIGSSQFIVFAKIDFRLIQMPAAHKSLSPENWPNLLSIEEDEKINTNTNTRTLHTQARTHVEQMHLLAERMYKSCKYRKRINQICPYICRTQLTISFEFDSFHTEAHFSNSIQFGFILQSSSWNKKMKKTSKEMEWFSFYLAKRKRRFGAFYIMLSRLLLKTT